MCGQNKYLQQQLLNSRWDVKPRTYTKLVRDEEVPHEHVGWLGLTRVLSPHSCFSLAWVNSSFTLCSTSGLKRTSTAVMARALAVRRAYNWAFSAPESFRVVHYFLVRTLQRSKFIFSTLLCYFIMMLTAVMMLNLWHVKCLAKYLPKITLLN